MQIHSFKTSGKWQQTYTPHTQCCLTSLGLRFSPIMRNSEIVCTCCKCLADNPNVRTKKDISCSYPTLIFRNSLNTPLPATINRDTWAQCHAIRLFLCLPSSAGCVPLSRGTCNRTGSSGLVAGGARSFLVHCRTWSLSHLQGVSSVHAVDYMLSGGRIETGYRCRVWLWHFVLNILSQLEIKTWLVLWGEIKGKRRAGSHRESMRVPGLSHKCSTINWVAAGMH